MPKVSVILPTRDRVELLQQAVFSVQAQTLPDWELLLIGDGASAELCAAAGELAARDSRIHFHNRPHYGVSAARNFGLQQANGEFIAFLDDDDLWLPEKLEKHLAVFDSSPDIALVGALTYVEKIGEDNRHITEPKKRPHSDRECSYRLFVECDFLATCAVVLRRSLVEGILFDEGMRVCEDWDYWVRVAEHHPYRFLEEALSVYRRHETNIGNDPVAVADGHLLALDKIQPCRRQGITHGLLRRRKAYEWYSIGVLWMDEREFDGARKAFGRALCLQPTVGLDRGRDSEEAAWKRLLKPYRFWFSCLKARISNTMRPQP
ncbi:MAG: glycosyltransferase family 2 protein [Candidatus Omnitrophica bacterium]|nr:glycosyltransferase family 2 protein [Candidatus Omnitrophota bacterium]